MIIYLDSTSLTFVATLNNIIILEQWLKFNF